MAFGDIRQTVETRFTARDGVTSVLNKIKRSSVSIRGSLRALTGSVANLAGLSGVIGAGGLAASFALLAKNGLDAGDNIAKTSDKLGIASEELTRLQFAVTQTSDVAEKQFNIALQRMTRRLAEAQNGNTGLTKRLNELGLSVEEFNGLSADQSFLKIADALKAIEDPAERVRLTFAFFDSEGVGLVNTLSKGSDAIRELGDQADDLGLSFDRISLAKIEAANDEFGRLRDLVKAAGIAIAVSAAQPLRDLATAATEWVKAQGGIQQVVENTFESVSNGVRRLSSLAVSVFEFFEGVIERIDKVRLAALKLERFTVFENLGITSAARQRNRERVEQLTQEIELIEARQRARESDQRVAETIGGPTVRGPDQAIAQLQAEQQARQRAEEQRIQDEALAAEQRRQLEEAEAERKRQAARLEAQRRAEQLAAENAAIAGRLQAAREATDEEFRIRSDFQRRIDQLNADATAAQSRGIALDFDVQASVRELQRLRDVALQELQNTRQELSNKAIGIDSLINFSATDVNTSNVTEYVAKLEEAIKSETAELDAGIAAGIVGDLDAAETREQIRSAALRARELIASTLTNTEAANDPDGGFFRVPDLSPLQGFAGQIISTQNQIASARESLALQYETQSQRIIDSEVNVSERLQELTRQRVAAQRRIEQGAIQARISLATNAIRQLFSVNDAENKKEFERNKKIQTATAIVDTIAAGVKAFRSAPWPANFAAMASVLATGYAQVRAIRKQTYNGGSASTAGVSAGSASAGTSSAPAVNQSTASSAQSNSLVTGQQGAVFAPTIIGKDSDTITVGQFRDFLSKYDDFVNDNGQVTALGATA